MKILSLVALCMLVTAPFVGVANAFVNVGIVSHSFSSLPQKCQIRSHLRVYMKSQSRSNDDIALREGMNGRRASMSFIVGALAYAVACPELPAFAASSAAEVASPVKDKDLLKLKVGLKGLNFLLDNWDDETIKCNYAEVPRELLETKNKAALLEAAKTSALFNKDSSMVVKCKRNPSAIRAYLGLNDPEEALYRADLTIAKYRNKVDAEKLDAYVDAEEKWTQIISSADAMSYGAIKRDYTVNNEFRKGQEEEKIQGTTFLQKAKEDVKRARDTLAIIIDALGV